MQNQDSVNLINLSGALDLKSPGQYVLSKIVQQFLRSLFTVLNDIHISWRKGCADVLVKGKLVLFSPLANEQ